MIRVDCTQGDEIWAMARVGVATASRFKEILTEKTLEFSKQSRKYMRTLAAEYFLGHPIDAEATQYMNRGVDLESDAREQYAFENNVTLDRVGFMLRADRKVGCSPDSLVGDDGGLEIKILSAENHIASLIDGVDPDEHKAQIQGCLWITNRDWWDRYYYHPKWPCIQCRIKRDDVFIDKLEAAVNQFIDQFDEMKERLERLGLVKAKPFDLAELERLRKERDERDARHAQEDAEFDRIVAGMKAPVATDAPTTEHEAAMHFFGGTNPHA